MMNTTVSHREFLTTQVPNILQNLQVDATPQWGMMTAQHMLEHLAKITKASVKQYGAPPAEPTEGQLKFKAFVNEGEFKKNDTKTGKLEGLHYATFDEAREAAIEAIEWFYQAFAQNPDLQPYNPTMGALSFDELQRLHNKHYRHHLKQFDLM
ncbi:DUF1569 domain-containing protein [Microscilla marina]|uniref:Uncharacterized protein n=1 Tax=Microscilla marina ATCC 23134 TaxID=313606 RepID=A1ZF49_MICM2|nr:DUF1569 domain-containing protein [Microscilla marina]EAY31151.1 hypothetical protein M23134_07561 [Microscilla marina ATCC 23134]